MTNTPEELKLEEKLKKYRPIEDTTKAREYLSRLCRGDKPTMCVPPEVNDWDMVFCRIISKCEELDARPAEPLPEDKAEAWERLQKTVTSGDIGHLGMLTMKTIKAALSAPAVDVEGLKKDVSIENREQAFENSGWNNCLDFMKSQGHLQPKQGE